MLKQGLDIRLGQSLSMTPQMQQAIRLLQLSSIELEAEIQQALLENPLLQQAGDDNSATEVSSNSEQDSPSDNSNIETEIPTDLDTNNMSSDIPDKIDMDADWSDVFDTRSSTADSINDFDSQGFLENQGESNEGLQEHLLWQVNMSQLSALDKHIAAMIISCLDDAGYLTESLDTLTERLNQELWAEDDDVQFVLKYIQQLDPLGVGARDLQECLLIQLNALPPDPLQATAIQLVTAHLTHLEKRQYKDITKALKINQSTLEDTVRLLRSLQPRPGSLFSSKTPDYIVPDVYVHKFHGQWVVSLNQQISPELQIDEYYAKMIGQVNDNKADAYLKGNLQQARWLIRSLENRHTTVLRVAQEIIKNQTAFLQYGEQAMKPLILRDIAEQLALHESTISRVTSNKYMYTPRGIYEFKYFFSSQLDTNTGSSCSSTAIRAMIKQLIDEENPKSPLSDSRLTQLIKEQGINVARRTIAKYREAMSIPPSHERKALLAN